MTGLLTRAPIEEPTVHPATHPNTAATEPEATDSRQLDLTGPLVFVMSAGLLVEAWAVGRSRGGDLGSGTQLIFWIGLLLIFAPATARVVARTTSNRERTVLAVGVTLAMQLSRTVLYPNLFAFHDEFIHANTLRQLLTSHHLFGDNPLLPVSSYYPGMEIATDGIHELTGLSGHTSAVVLLLLARVVSTLALIGLIQRVTGSTRAACIAGIVYLCNPQAIFFNAQYSYESFALPLAIFVLYAFVSRARGTRPQGLVLPGLALAAVVVSHHLTAIFVVLALGVWFALDLSVSRRGRSSDWRGLAVLSGLGAVAVVGWALLPGNPVLGYLRTIGTSSVNDIRARLSGQSSHQLFHSSGGLTSPLWERAATIGSILIVLGAVIPTIFLLRRWLRGGEAILILLGVTALLYPIIPLGHVTPGTGEVTDRASGFLFVGIGVAVGLGPAFRPRPTARFRARYFVPVLTALFSVVFAGGVILGAGPTVGQLPGPFLVSADARSIDAANISAAIWERENLAPGTRVYADRDSGLLAAAVGGLHTVTHVADDIDASQILLAPTFTATDRRLIRAARIRYVIVDQRDSEALPNQEVYIESGEYGSENRTKPVTAQALHKLATVRGVQRVYSNGPIVIYDVRALDAS